MKKTMFVVALLASAMGAPAMADPITGTGQPISSPALAGGTVIDFEGDRDGTAATRTFGNVTIAGTSVVSGTFAGQYNTFGKYLHNNSGETNVFTFTFANPVSAFGFNLGAADFNWTLSAGGQTYTFGPTFGGNAKNFYGISGSNLRTATATFASTDYVLLDNITTAAGAVPEPATWGMMLVGFGAMGYAMRRRAKVRTNVSFA